MDRGFQMEDLDKEFRSVLQPAREDAETITLWEKITQSNHEDVTYYKGLLRQYSRAMMNTMIRDMLEDV
jgi:phenylpropionate dioxygenase-like ring-hydroxylating dioxygenase large terminal subunit